MVSTIMTKTVKNLIQEASKKQLKIAVIETCTGGMISCAITENSEADNIYAKGIILPSKDKFSRDIENQSEENIKNLSESLDSDIILSSTGIVDAGPDKDESEIGLAFISVLINGEVITEKFKFPGNRHDVKLNITETALEFLLRKITEL